MPSIFILSTISILVIKENLHLSVALPNFFNFSTIFNFPARSLSGSNLVIGFLFAVELIRLGIIAF